MTRSPKLLPCCSMFRGSVLLRRVRVMPSRLGKFVDVVLKVVDGCFRCERYCVQFLLMFLTYTAAWLTFFVYPAIGIKAPEAYAITLGIVVLNGGVNSIIYLILNKEVRLLSCPERSNRFVLLHIIK
ncbi:unnamed protein product [Heligmosomoides polygyrus]|uniref:7TM_GPCR_Srx domain-containing protein n=1 Tax=Heligmosomoides polygyrus TaxID=6339 RepID=A0A3P8CH44_HELPZ|nr:unnamed protein product [Heligmosomoides polygyrus]